MTAFKKRCDRFKSTGVPILDEQHEALFREIYRLHEAMLSKSSKAVVPKIIENLKSLLEKHFKYEESYLGDAVTKEHKDSHRMMLKKFNEIVEAYNRTKVGISIKLMDFFYTSLFTHIEKLDSVYVRGDGCQRDTLLQS